MSKIVQVIKFNGGGTYLTTHIVALFDDGKIYEGTSHQGADHRHYFRWEECLVPPRETEK